MQTELELQLQLSKAFASKSVMLGATSIPTVTEVASASSPSSSSSSALVFSLSASLLDGVTTSSKSSDSRNPDSSSSMVSIDSSEEAKGQAESLASLIQRAEINDAKAQNSLGQYYKKNKEEKKAFNWTKKAAFQGYKVAQNNLGVFYQNGVGTEKVPKTAVFWYRKAAEQGHSVAQYNLANCYKKGIGVNKGEKKAADWYHKAANQGYAPAQNELVLCYQKGSGVVKDNKQAIIWFNRAVEQGHQIAKLNLATCCIRLHQVAKFGCAIAQNTIGWLYEEGTVVEKNGSLAADWYLKAAVRENPQAQYNLSRCYEQGIGGIHNLKLAEMWGKIAAEQTLNKRKDSPNDLSAIYEDRVIIIDNDEAANWYSKARKRN